MWPCRGGGRWCQRPSDGQAASCVRGRALPVAGTRPRARPPALIGTATAQERRCAALQVRGCTRSFGPLPLIGSRRSLAAPACTAWVLRVGRREPARRCGDRGDASMCVDVLVWWPVAQPLSCRGALPGRPHTARVPSPRRRPRSTDGSVCSGARRDVLLGTCAVGWTAAAPAIRRCSARHHG